MRQNSWYCHACRKTAYPSQRRAESAMTKIQNSGNVRRGGPKRVYACPYGNGHHLTSKTFAEME